MRTLSSGAADLTEDELIAAYAVPDRAERYVRVNMVSSLDGAVSIAGLSGGLSSKDDQDLLGRLRMLSDVVLVGAGTLQAEAYDGLRLGRRRREWRLSNGLPENPVLAVVSGTLGLEPTHRALVNAPVRPVVITSESAPKDRLEAFAEVADVLVCGEDEVDLAGAMAALADRGLPQILSEGGPRLLGSLTAADLVDELCLSLSPLLAGSGSGRITGGPPSTEVHRLVPTQVLVSDDGFLFLRCVRDPSR